MATELNRNFASAIGADGLPVYAPAYIMVGGRLKLHPTADDYAAHTPPCYPVLANSAPSDAPSGYHYEFRSYEFADGAFRRTYALVADPPPPPSRWSRLAIETALAQANMLDAADAYLAQVPIVGTLTAARAFSRCDYIEEGYPTAERWNALLEGAASALGKTRAEIDAFLATIPTEGAL